MSAGGPVLDPPHVQHCAIEVDLVPTQIADLSRPKPVAECEQDHRGVPMTVSVGLGGLDQASTSPTVRCSRARSSTFRRRVGATVRKILVDATNFSAEFFNDSPRARTRTVRT